MDCGGLGRVMRVLGVSVQFWTKTDWRTKVPSCQLPSLSRAFALAARSTGLPVQQRYIPALFRRVARGGKIAVVIS